MTNNCNKCKYALMHDYGYSNYTVEGITFYCLLNKHPEGSYDRWYGEESRLEYAKECSSYIKGDPVEIDVDKEAIPYGAEDQSIAKWYAYGDQISLVKKWEEENM